MDPEAIEQLIDSGRDGYEARLAAGQARLEQGDLNLAAEHLRKATDFKPDQTMGWMDLGKALSQSGDDDGAREAWAKGVERAAANGDKQAEKIMGVWLKRLDD